MKPKEFWLPDTYQEDSEDTREEMKRTLNYIKVIDKDAFDKLEKEKALLVKFIKHYSREGHDSFGFMTQAPSILRKVGAKDD